MNVFIASKSERFEFNPTDNATLGVFNTEEEAVECLRKQEEKDMTDLKSKNPTIKFNKCEFFPEEVGDHFRCGHMLHEDDSADDLTNFRDITLGYFVECYEIGTPVVTNILDMF